MINFVRGRVKPGFTERFLAAVTVGLVALVCTTQLITVVRKVVTTAILFDVDEANHATDGWEVYHALISRSSHHLYRSVVEQSFYPPVHSFFIAAGYALGEPTLAASRLPTVVNMALVLALLVCLTGYLAREAANRPSNAWLLMTSAALVLAFAVTSKAFITNGVLAMVEMTGALLGLLLVIDYFPFEQYEHSLARTNRKPQIASTDPTFPRLHLNEILERGHFAAIIEIKDLNDYFGPRANNPEDPLCRYPVQKMEMDGWIVMVYDLQGGAVDGCG